MGAAYVCVCVCVQGSGAAGAGHGQTREHAQLARSLGVEQLAVVITKLDLADHDPVRVP